MAGATWPQFDAYYADKFDHNKETIFDYLDTDFRWLRPTDCKEESFNNPERVDNWKLTYSDQRGCSLAGCETALAVEKLFSLNSERMILPDFAETRRKHPEHALAFLKWKPLLCGAWEKFGMEEALCKMYLAPVAVECYMEIEHQDTMTLLQNVLKQAGESIDFIYLGDDYASEDDLIISPQMWKKFIYPRLRAQVDLIHSYGKKVIFHSCGAVSSLYPYFLDIGIDAHLVFQTTARGIGKALRMKCSGIYVHLRNVAAMSWQMLITACRIFVLT